MISDLSFIADEGLRTTIKRDLEELKKCKVHGAYKSAMLLAGSLIEAILVDYFLAFQPRGKNRDKILSAGLASLLDWAGEDGLISQSTKEISTVIKNYRNLIHPGREYRLGEKIDKYRAEVATNLVYIIIQEIADNYAERRGYSAEDAIYKVKRDPLSVAIFPHMVRKMSLVERERLFRALAYECYATKDEGVLERYVSLHRKLKSAIRREVLAQEAQKVYEFVRTKDSKETMFYLRLFAEDLGQLEEEQRAAVLVYTLEVLRTAEEPDLRKYYRWRVYSTIGQYLDNEIGTEKVLEVIVSRAADQATENDMFLRIVGEQILSSMVQQGDTIISELKESFWWIPQAEEWAEILEGYRIPF